MRTALIWIFILAVTMTALLGYQAIESHDSHSEPPDGRTTLPVIPDAERTHKRKSVDKTVDSAAGHSGQDADIGLTVYSVTTTIQSEEDIARKAESKDLDWSYGMEQALQQFMATHPSAVHFTFAPVDCRSSHCTIRANTFDDSALPKWQSLANDIKQQRWSQFGVTGTSSARSRSGLELTMTLYRTPPPS